MNGQIFVSYSHDDKPWLDRLEPLLKQAHVQFDLESWTDEKINVSATWRKEISSALENATAAVLLISGNFLSSPFIREVETARLLERAKSRSLPIFPLLISDCLWQKVPWLAEIQVFPYAPPTPLDQVPTKEEQDRLLLTFVGRIIDQLKLSSPTRIHTSGFESTQPAPGSPIAKSQRLDTQGAIVLAMDIRDFSLMGADAQREAIKALWHIIQQPSTAVRSIDVLPHEDGVLLIFPAAEGAHQAVRALTHSWISALSALSVELRVALHQGVVSRLEIPALATTVSFGTTINECRKLCSFSGSGQIVISDSFLDGWEDLGGAAYDDLSPGRGKAPFDVMVKEDRQIGIRISGDKDGELPKRLAFLNFVDREIFGRLDLIEEAFVDFLRCPTLRHVRRLTSPRISILSPVRRHGKLFLTSSLFRYQHGDQDVKKPTIKQMLAKPGRTFSFYDLDPPGSGTCGRAFVSGKIQIATGLPDFRADEVGYIRRWKDSWGMDEEDVLGFSRKSRAVISIPFGIKDWPTLGVVCLDCMHPLTGGRKLKPSSLLQFCREIDDEFMSELSLLWMHRMQL